MTPIMILSRPTLHQAKSSFLSEVSWLVRHFINALNTLRSKGFRAFVGESAVSEGVSLNDNFPTLKNSTPTLPTIPTLHQVVGTFPLKKKNKINVLYGRSRQECCVSVTLSDTPTIPTLILKALWGRGLRHPGTVGKAIDAPTNLVGDRKYGPITGGRR